MCLPNNYVVLFSCRRWLVKWWLLGFIIQYMSTAIFSEYSKPCWVANEYHWAGHFLNNCISAMHRIWSINNFWSNLAWKILKLVCSRAILLQLQINEYGFILNIVKLFQTTLLYISLFSAITFLKLILNIYYFFVNRLPSYHYLYDSIIYEVLMF